MMKKSRIIFALIVACTLIVLPVVSALVVVPEGGRALVYENGSYIVLPEGTYDTVTRIDNVWYVNGLEFTGELVDPTPTETPETPITTTEYILIVIWIVFLLVAFLSREPFLFGVSGFISLILGLDLALIYIGASSEWIFGIVGFALVMFGIFLMILALTVKSKGAMQR